MKSIIHADPYQNETLAECIEAAKTACNKHMNYRLQRLTCRFCEHWDLARDLDNLFSICSLTKESIDDAGICDRYEAAKDANGVRG